MATNYVFKRIEKKYLMTKEQHEALLNKIAPYMTRDQYGLHTICNLYFDTAHFDLLSRSIEKPVYKEKLRIRSYGIPTNDSTVFIELKKKYKGIVYKRRIEASLEQTQAFLTGQHQAVPDEQIAKEIQYFLEFYHAYPRVYIAYDREAYFCEEDENLNYADIFDDIFHDYTKKTQLVRVKTTNLGSMFELSYRITMKKEADEKQMLDAIRCRNGNLTIVCGMVQNDPVETM